MIFDGRWKRELKFLSFEMAFWQRISIIDYITEHRLNRAVLYSATILRKIIEDEIEAEDIAKEANIPLPKLKTTHAILNAIKYPYVGEEGWAIRSSLCASNYGKGQDVCVKAKDVCNWLLHSYVWGVARDANTKRFVGFLVASDFDKEKFIHFISLAEWNDLLKLVIENGKF